jgi:hypothetical protein
MSSMHKRADRLVALVLLLLQAAMLTFVPAWSAAAGTLAGTDFCRAASAIPAAPDSPPPPHSAHACGDCCTAYAGPLPAAAEAFASVVAPSAAPLVADTSPAQALSATVLPPACGPPAAA